MNHRLTLSSAIALLAIVVTHCSSKDSGHSEPETPGAMACFAIGTTPAFYGCSSTSDCQAGNLCIDNGGDHHYYCKPICTGTTGDCASYVGNGQYKPGPGGGGPCPIALCPDGTPSGIPICESQGSTLAPGYAGSSCCGGGASAKKGPCTNPSNVAGAWNGCYGPVSCGSCSTQTQSCFSFTIPDAVAQNGGLFTDDQGNTFELDVSTCTASLATIDTYGSGTTGAACGAGAGTTTIDFNAGAETTGLQCPTDNCMSCGTASASISR
jgi:hypothetical protein